jgi:hypothetical protein
LNTWTNIATIITAIFGVALGSASLVLGIVNYLRDKPKIKILLQWYMEIRDDSLQRVGGMVEVLRQICLKL